MMRNHRRHQAIREGKLKKSVFFIAILVFVLPLAACSSGGATPKVTTIVLSAVPLPTYTMFPTYTLYPTYTSLPTLLPDTPTLTSSPTKTKTPTRTATSTPIPETSTAAAKTEISASTMVAKTEIALSTAAVKTEIASTKTAKAAFLAQFANIDYRELRDYPNQHKGEKVCLRGIIFNIVSDKAFQMYMDSTYDALYVEFENPFSGIYDNSSIWVCGTVFGTTTFKNAYGADVTQPALYLAFKRGV